ncbi:restriction endonuclease subunit S [Vibrio aerogenes]|uniref:restriction endonuclease subunit S n=1 Tax=Vibrio aerogenes TaxID=92172 RepID=UPI0021C261A8|nr:restriction endonuclease subunit S [Vibrio aerogenes]
MSVESLITQHIDIWTSAVQTKSTAGRGTSSKLDLYGIKKLRELILELAVRGKLVPQDPNDEPASALLERIEKEKAQLVKDNKIKKPKKLPNISEKDIPFKLPKGWCFSRLESICELITKGSSPKWQGVSYTENPEDILFVTSENVGAFELLLDKKKYVEQKFNEIEPRSILRKDDFLMNIVGASIGRTALYNIDDIANINQAVCLIRSFPQQVSSGFFLTFFNSNTCVSYMYDKQVDNARPNLSMGNISKFVIPIPPLKEQHRIVAKVDELMKLCDQLEQQTEASITAHQVLVETLLATLTNSKNAEELMENWQRISAHFDTLFTTEESIDQLKQTILQLAVMGKLVPQNPADESASVLLERIAKEKAQLVKDKKIKKQKALPPIADDEKPFELPDGWEWCRLDDICHGITSGSTPPKSIFHEQAGVPYLKVYNIRNQKIDFEYNSQFVDPDYHSSKLARSILYPGDVVMNIVGPPLGKIAVIPDSYPEWNCNQAIVFFRPIERLFNQYIYTYLMAGTFLDSIELIGTAGQDNISVTKSRSIVLPTPPLEEQFRIVSMVNELMGVCEDLKQHVRHSQKTRLKLTNSIVEQAL